MSEGVEGESGMYTCGVKGVLGTSSRSLVFSCSP